MTDIIRYRTHPRIYDFNYFVCKNNLAGIKYLSNKFKSVRNVILLDIGCGKKPFRDDFSYCRYIGIDITNKDADPDMIMDLNFKKLPFKNNYFDIIIVSEAIEHIFNNQNLIREMKRSIKPGGCIFISSPFIFPEHGSPHDYFRFTKYYFHQTFKEFNIAKYSESNSIITSPLILCNIIIFQMLNLFSFPVILVNNLLIYLIEIILTPIRKFTKFKNFIQSAPTGYYFVFEKK
ncbi:MAG: class I SAM-dependent methyltransferase [Nanoarchaeota archaeon]|nr:class I SAM-dependent methyltransferase [Nanoarchaeota archaeon]